MTEKGGFSRRNLKGPDEFISTFARVVAWCKENRARFTIGVISVVCVAAIGLGALAYGQWVENKAALDLWPTLNRAQMLLQSPGGADPSQLADVERFLQKHISSHRNTGSAVFSFYYLGNIAFSRGNFDQAIEQYRAGIATGKETGVMKYLLREGIAGSFEAKGDLAAAGAAYRDAESAAGGNLKILSKLGEARVLGLAGKKVEAASIYRLILNEMQGSPLRDLVELRLAQTE